MFDSKVQNYHYPILAYSIKEKRSKEEIIKIWDKFDLLSENAKEKVSSKNTAEKIKSLSQSFELHDDQITIISRAIRSYYFGELALEDFPSVLSKEMEIDLNTAKEISQIVIQKIINDDSTEKAYQARMEHISLLEALKKYPEIEDQAITQDSIKTRNYQDPVRPSVKNWLSDYTARLGYTSHDSIERGNYLFQSENTRNLSYGDRQKLSQILKSFDEKTPLTVDADAKQIIFLESLPNTKPDLRPAATEPTPKLPQTPEVEFSHAYDVASGNAYQPKTQEPGKDFEKVIGLPEKEEKTPAENTRIVNLKEQVEKNPPPAPPKPKNLLNIKELIQQSREERAAQEAKSGPVPKNPQAGISNPQIPQRPVSPFSKPAPNQSPDENARVLDFSGKPKGVERKEPVQKGSRAPLSGNSSLHPQDYFQKELETPRFRESLDNAEKELFQRNNSDSNIQFSSPQKLPHEKEQEKLQEKPVTQTQPSTPPKSNFPPYRI